MGSLQDEYIWYQIRERLGSEKTARLRFGNLEETVANHADKHYGTDLRGQVTLSGAFGVLGKLAAEDAQLVDDIQAMATEMRALSASTTKTASPEPAMPWDDMTLVEKVAYSKQLFDLEEISAGTKYASAASSARELLNAEIYDTLYKTATLASSLGDLAQTGLKGTAMAGGAAVPLYMLGQAYNEDARDKALQAAAGTAALGVGVLGANKLMDQMGTKSASLQRNTTAMEEFLATVHVDATLKTAAEYTPEVRELMKLNHEYGMSLLYRTL